MTVTRRSALKVIAGAGAACAATALPAPAEGRERRKPGPDDVGLLYDATLCVGCRACVRKCKEANGLPPDRRELQGAVYDAPDDLNAQTKNIIRLHVEGNTTSYVKGGCMHCTDPACVSVCMVGALHKSKGGIVAYDKDLCVGCRYCQLACPFNVPKFEWAKAFPLIVKCELCRDRKEGPACAEVCPRGAIEYGKVTALREEARRRLAAEPKKYNGKVYGESEVGGTHVMYLAAVPFEKLGLPQLPSEPVPELSETISHGIYKGFIAPVVLWSALAVTIWRNRKKGAEGEEKP